MENALILFGFLPVTMENYESNRASQKVRRISAVYWLSGSNKVELEENESHLVKPFSRNGNEAFSRSNCRDGGAIWIKF